MQQSSSYLAELVRLNDTLIWSWDRMDSFVAAVRIIRDTVGATLAPSFLVDPTGTRLELVGGARERAALEWTEALTLIAQGGVSDAAYATASAAFSKQELAYLTTAVGAINVWNRIAGTYHFTPQPAA